MTSGAAGLSRLEPASSNEDGGRVAIASGQQPVLCHTGESVVAREMG